MPPPPITLWPQRRAALDTDERVKVCSGRGDHMVKPRDRHARRVLPDHDRLIDKATTVKIDPVDLLKKAGQGRDGRAPDRDSVRVVRVQDRRTRRGVWLARRLCRHRGRGTLEVVARWTA